eukprot:gnl/TRDRNA2_/TRDRNA2_62895_c0_seq1.p1 gnl/TRDRNA2_/TRDRNA2_62895_c0~~gnl/TRDRNA2_/TRDRNA2_62895_c0_seq1.p1  ORF type:complete len:343 (+),score=56.46 gnl/TRDRNA2_/TRDRNA2_62895_c0_seq1:66-1094(+)
MGLVKVDTNVAGSQDKVSMTNSEASTVKVQMNFTKFEGKVHTIAAGGEWVDRGLPLPEVDVPSSENHDVTVPDARPSIDEYNTPSSLDRHSFMHCCHTSAISGADFYDGAKITSEYYREAEKLLRDVTGAFKAVVLEHVWRNSGIVFDVDPDDPKKYEDSFTKKYVHGTRVEPAANGAHSDFTRKAAMHYIQSALQANTPEEAEEVLKTHRVALINVWRSIGVNPVKDNPLAVIDARSCKIDDLFPIRMLHYDWDGGICGIKHSSRHQWKYVSDMTSQEVLLLKLFDSEMADGQGGDLDGVVPTGHSAFHPPSWMVPNDWPHRESIELRSVVFWPRQGVSRL